MTAAIIAAGITAIAALRIRQAIRLGQIIAAGERGRDDRS
jgi:hypothetical protein